MVRWLMVRRQYSNMRTIRYQNVMRWNDDYISMDYIQIVIFQYGKIWPNGYEDVMISRDGKMPNFKKSIW